MRATLLASTIYHRECNHTKSERSLAFPSSLAPLFLVTSGYQQRESMQGMPSFEDCFSYQNRCWSDIIKAYGKDCWDFPDPRCCFAPAMKNKLSYD